ncbi:hypothetical protein Tco_1198590, partial [Tanacetum coccineum]
SSSEEAIANEPSTLVLDNHSNEPVQEDVAELNKNTFINPFGTRAFKEAELSSLPGPVKYARVLPTTSLHLQMDKESSN